MAAPKPSLKSFLTDLIECSICQDVFDDPRSLPCLHTFCLKCIRDACKAMPAFCAFHSCPQCRKLFSLPSGGVEALPHDFKTASLVERVKNDDYCTAHPDDFVMATKFCIKCGEYACSLCEVTRHYDCLQQNCMMFDEASRHFGERINAEAERVSSLGNSFRNEVSG